MRALSSYEGNGGVGGDEDRLKGDSDRSGMLYALLLITHKIGQALSIGIVFTLLDVIGFNAAAGQANGDEADQPNGHNISQAATQQNSQKATQQTRQTATRQTNQTATQETTRKA